jgi:hypothetical protein
MRKECSRPATDDSRTRANGVMPEPYFIRTQKAPPEVLPIAWIGME